MGMLAVSDEIVFIAVYHHCFYLGNHTHSCQKAEVYNSLLCIPAYTDKDRHFPALQYVHLHMQTLVCSCYILVSDIRYWFTYVLTVQTKHYIS
jgi:hypothetical protein